MSNRAIEDRDTAINDAVEMQIRCDALRKENEELRGIIHDAVGPTVAWASEWQNRNGTADLHPQHQELIDRMTAATQSTSK